ncbi:hypothetical protein GF361_02325 [Candidatus Woesearchaeota archaeon]|nr:hypothetical protein [Candidatus Woesearchaeota archaeon]
MEMMKMNLNRKTVVKGLVGVLEEELENLKESFNFSRQTVIDAPGAMQSQHDTTGKEASWLADGTATRIGEIEQAIYDIQNINYPEPNGRVLLGSVVMLKNLNNDLQAHYFIGPSEGGTTVDINGIELTIITPVAPITQAMFGKYPGEEFEIPGKDVKYKIEDIG